MQNGDIVLDFLQNKGKKPFSPISKWSFRLWL